MRIRPLVAPIAYVCSVVAGMCYVVGPGNLAWTGGFITGSSRPIRSSIPPGDHLQVAYNLWLWKDSLTTLSHWPWWDPYLYGATSQGLPQPFGWPLVLFCVPITFIWGPVASYNATVVGGFVLAAGVTFCLCRELGCAWWAAAVGGFAYAFAPFRILQGAEHANAILAWMFPLLLLCYEMAVFRCGRQAKVAAWAAVVVQVSIVLCGDLHLGNYSVLLGGAWLLVRLPRAKRAHLRTLVCPATVCAAATLAAAAVVYIFVIVPAVADGRSSAEAAIYAPRLADLVQAVPGWPTSERYVYPGLVIAVLAVRGFRVMLGTNRSRRALAWTLAAGVGVTLFLAVSPSATNATIRDIYRAVPFLSFSRTPGRIAVITTLLFAVFAAFAIDDVGDRRAQAIVAVVASALIVFDAPTGLYASLSGPVRPLVGVPSGATVLELPPFDARDVTGSVYSFFLMSAPGPRVGGYSLLATPAARDKQQETTALAKTPIDSCAWRDLTSGFGVQYVAVYTQLFGPTAFPGSSAALVVALAGTPGFELVSSRDRIVVLKVSPAQIPCELGR